MTAVRFDQVISLALDKLRHFGELECETTLVRDAFGALSVVLPDDALVDPEDWIRLAALLHDALGVYSPGERQVLLRISDLIDASDVTESPDRVRLPDIPNAWLVDRLQTNQDWLRESLIEHPPVPTAVAFSIKGGVGRTTAFALWAWHLARLGKNIVLVDLDLEAPGVAGMLLDEDRLPDYGLVDWLIEALVGQADDELLWESLAECGLSGDETGRIRILPAFGKKTKEYISKLGRIYMPTFAADAGKFSGLAERLAMLLEQIAGMPNRTDAVLLDARAGLHDIGSAAVTRLGAEVFLFARDDGQSWQAYRQLFDHLHVAKGVVWGMPDRDLRWRLKMVAAQSEAIELARTRFIERSYEAWLELYDEEKDEKDDHRLIGGPQLFSPDDKNGPHYPLFVQFDPRIRNFDLIDLEKRPAWSIVETAFGDFFSGATARLFPNGSALEDC
jgi:cellulose biosynthesis protein BcsQ